jgi:signal transduction histidine kinase
MPASAGMCAYRIVQEALASAGRHARGARITVALGRDQDRLRLRVVNGPAAAPGSAPRDQAGGHGLVGMRERVAALGGTLRSGPTADGGFALSACLPLISSDSPAAS